MLKHEGICKNFSAKNAGAYSPSANVLANHEREHKDKPQYPNDGDKDEEKNISCQNCGKSFRKKYTLKRHQSTCGGGGKRHSCHYCSKPFNRRKRNDGVLGLFCAHCLG